MAYTCIQNETRLQLSYHYKFARFDFLVGYGNNDLFQQQEGEYQCVVGL